MKKLAVAYLSFIFSVFFGYMAAGNLPLPLPMPEQQTVLVSGLAKNQEPTGTEVTPDIRVALFIAAASEAAKQLEASPSAVQPTPTVHAASTTAPTPTQLEPTLSPTELPTPTPTIGAKPTSVPKSSATVVNDSGSAIVIPQQDSSAQIEGAVVTTN